MSRRYETPSNGGEEYISVDIEASGPIPGEYSMLSIGACLVRDIHEGFYAELRPTSDRYISEALEVSGFSLACLRENGIDPPEAMTSFCKWIKEVCADRRPVFVGFNASFDWSFVNWYFHKFLKENPFGIGGVDIKAYYMGLSGSEWNDTTSSKLPSRFQSSLTQTHHALEDAQAQAEIFKKLLEVPLSNRKVT
jgi:DNA polymerase III epsilon subunit-like protein